MVPGARRLLARPSGEMGASACSHALMSQPPGVLALMRGALTALLPLRLLASPCCKSCSC